MSGVWMTAKPPDPASLKYLLGLPGVSRETIERLRAYADLLCQWNPKINLVGPATLAELWPRHIIDSAQLIFHIPAQAKILVDLGSGAGLPGLILAILGFPEIHLPEIHLIESDQRKCVFLREAARVTGVKVTIHPQRIEAVTPFAADIITARALAPLSQLLDWAAPFLAPQTICLFPKGKTAEDELTQARRQWIMKTQMLVSESDETSYILRLEELNHAPNRLPGRATDL